MKINKKLVVGIIIVVAIAIVAIASIKIIPAGSTGVVMTFGKVGDTVMQEGFNFKIPFIQTVSVVNNKIQVVEVNAPAVSKDLQTVNSVIAVNFRVGLDSGARVYKNIGQDYKDILLLPAIQESIKSVTAKYTAEELITMRSQVGIEIKETLENKVSEYGINIEEFNIVNFDFSEEFNAAIEAKQVAEQNLIKTETEQKQAIVIAEAEAQRKIIEANAAAEATLKQAQAQSEANKLLSQSLSDTIVEYEMIQKWNGELPKATGGTGIFDFREAATQG